MSGTFSDLKGPTDNSYQISSLLTICSKQVLLVRFSPPPEVVLLANSRVLSSRVALHGKLKKRDASFQNKKLERKVFALCLLVNSKIQHLLSTNNKLRTIN